MTTPPAISWEPVDFEKEFQPARAYQSLPLDRYPDKPQFRAALKKQKFHLVAPACRVMQLAPNSSVRCSLQHPYVFMPHSVDPEDDAEVSYGFFSKDKVAQLRRAAPTPDCLLYTDCLSLTLLAPSSAPRFLHAWLSGQLPGAPFAERRESYAWAFQAPGFFLSIPWSFSHRHIWKLVGPKSESVAPAPQTTRRIDLHL